VWLGPKFINCLGLDHCSFKEGVSSMWIELDWKEKKALDTRGLSLALSLVGSGPKAKGGEHGGDGMRLVFSTGRVRRQWSPRHGGDGGRSTYYRHLRSESIVLLIKLSRPTFCTQ
jgi:hypothetical protein